MVKKKKLQRRIVKVSPALINTNRNRKGRAPSDDDEKQGDTVTGTSDAHGCDIG
jgi:hypothetical protein